MNIATTLLLLIVVITSTVVFASSSNSIHLQHVTIDTSSSSSSPKDNLLNHFLDLNTKHNLVRTLTKTVNNQRVQVMIQVKDHSHLRNLLETFGNAHVIPSNTLVLHGM
jgi:hypothetical protein